MSQDELNTNPTGDILIIDDTLANLQLLFGILTKAGYQVRPATNGQSGLKAAAAKAPDLILLDISMPEMDGFEVCRKLKSKERSKGIPVIFISALDSAFDKAECFQLGAVDYITKPFEVSEVLARVKTHLTIHSTQSRLESANRQLELAHSELEQFNTELEARVQKRTSELKDANEALLESEERFRSYIEYAPDGIFVTDNKGICIDVNRAACHLTGDERAILLGRSFTNLAHPEDKQYVEHNFEKVKHSGQIAMQFRFITKNNDVRYWNVDIVKLSGTRFLGFARDITNSRQMESQLRQAQKMEAIGTLAGGIAHDFNNILVAIIGYAEIVQAELKKGSEPWTNLNEVLKAGERAKQLVKQILTFSRQSEKEKEPLQIHLIIKEALKLLRASIPSSIEIKNNIDTTDCMILADPTQIHQVMMNLCTNAYHSMRETGGVLSVNLAHLDIQDDDPKVSSFDLIPGQYASLVITDTGCGIDSATLDRIFEPYFTTKKKGDGTGMGLAVVHGIVKNHGGCITVQSEPGQGTTFQVCLPVIATEVTGSDVSLTEDIPVGNERILVVDDEQVIANIELLMLEYLGYKVTTMLDSAKAVQMFNSRPEDFDLVITDMTMPKMSGAELSEAILAIRPDIPIILCTGYSELINDKKAKAIGIREFVMKPIILKELATVIRRVLDTAETEYL